MLAQQIERVYCVLSSWLWIYISEQETPLFLGQTEAKVVSLYLQQ